MTEAVIAGGDLDPATAFTVVSFFVLVRMPFTILPMALPLFADCIVSFDRFTAFFNLKTQPLSHFERPDATAAATSFLSIKDGNFAYPLQSDGKEDEDEEDGDIMYCCCVGEDHGSICC